MKEQWKETLRFPKDSGKNSTDIIIQASNIGNIKRLEYIYFMKINNTYAIKKEYLYIKNTNRGKQRYDSIEKIKKYGLYENVNIQGKAYAVHRLVAKAWIQNKENKPQINHINGIRNDNSIENLEWCTNKENQNHAIKTGMRNHMSGIGIRINNNLKLKIIEFAQEKISPKEISNRLNNQVSHEFIRIFLKHENIKYNIIRKKRTRKSDAYYLEQNKKYKQNYTIDSDEINAILKMAKDGFITTEIHKIHKNLTAKIQYMKKQNIDIQSILNQNNHIFKQIIEQKRGIHKRSFKNHNLYTYSAQFNEKKIKQSFKNINEALDFKFEYLKEQTINKIFLSNSLTSVLEKHNITIKGTQ